MKLATTCATRRVAAVVTAVVILQACSDPEAPDPAPDSKTPVAFVTVSPSTVALVAGQSEQLKATTRDQVDNVITGRPIAWETSASAVATVSTGGMVTGVGAGAATITATSEGKSGSTTVSVTAVSMTAFASVTTGGAHTCALTADGAAYCWGRGESGQLGVAAITTTCPLASGALPCMKVPAAVGGGLTFAQLAGGAAHTCGLTSDGTAYCWGSNSSGQLGDNALTNRAAPVPVATGLKFVRIDAGSEHTCALTSDDRAYCWGSNSRGQLGDGTTTLRWGPVAVTGGHTFRRIAAGGYANGHTCALTSGGDVYCWGDNERGQLGLGTGGAVADLTAHPEPARVIGELPFTAVAAGLARHACALTVTGAAYCWGENTFGALGDGSSRPSPVPVAVQGGLALTQVIAGGFIGHTCGLTASGAAHCWGENEVGALGDGSTVDREEPTAVAGGLSFTSLDAGLRHTCGRATTGAVYCWGSNGAGQLGINSTILVVVPTKVVGQP